MKYLTLIALATISFTSYAKSEKCFKIASKVSASSYALGYQEARLEMARSLKVSKEELDRFQKMTMEAADRSNIAFEEYKQQCK